MDWKNEVNAKLDTLKTELVNATDPGDLMMLVDDLATFISVLSSGSGLEEAEEDDGVE
jgi:hypothetical protein